MYFHFGVLLKNNKTGKYMTGWAGWQQPFFMAIQLWENTPRLANSRFSHIACLWGCYSSFSVFQPPGNPIPGKSGNGLVNCFVLKSSILYNEQNSSWKTQVFPPKRMSKAFIDAKNICILLHKKKAFHATWIISLRSRGTFLFVQTFLKWPEIQIYFQPE